MKWEFNQELEKEYFKNHENRTLTYLLFEGEEILKEEINFETLREIHFKKCKLNNVTFDNTFLGKVKFENCELNNVSMSNCTISKTIFTNCKLINVSFFEDVINDLVVEESLIEYSKIENSKMNNSLFDDVKLLENIHRHNKYEKINFYKCKFISENLIDAKFKECDLKTSHFEDTNINFDDLITSKLSLLNVLELVNSKGIVVEE